MKITLYAIALTILVVSSAQAREYGLIYKGYDCTVDCSGHKAGYDWAKKKNIKSHDECGGRSRSFIEGCYAWVDSQGDNSDQSTDDEDDFSDNEDESPDP